MISSKGTNDGGEDKVLLVKDSYKELDEVA
jgi:hypothetical protein